MEELDDEEKKLQEAMILGVELEEEEDDNVDSQSDEKTSTSDLLDTDTGNN